jgi:subtilisin
VPWNIKMVGADRVWDRVTGAGVKVAVLDTGIDENHPDLTVSGGASMVPGNTSWDDDQGHGTHCGGIIGARNNKAGVVGVAPNSKLYAVKVLNQAGTGYLSWILAGMGWAENNGMDVASMSLGSNVDKPDAPCTLAYQRAAERLTRAGCITVAAAGNNGRDPVNPWVGNPARCAGFMAVAAVDRNKDLAAFSSRGPSSLCNNCGVEIAAPGVSINSTVRGGGYGIKSGTSMACPHVSGAAALLKELHPTWGPATIRARLRATADDLGAPGNDVNFGSGLLNCYRAVFG